MSDRHAKRSWCLHRLVLPLLHPTAKQTSKSCVQSVTDKLKEKLSGDEKDKVEKAVQAALDWMDENQVGAGLLACKLRMPSWDWNAWG